MPKVSIIVPVYNLEQYLKQCVESIIKQTLDDIEIILVDDGSTDSCPQICDYYAQKDYRVKVIHQKNIGLSGARNKGIMMCTSKWFMIVDGDDWLEPYAAEILYEKAEKYQSDIFIASFYTNTQKTQIKDSFFSIKEFHYTTKEEMFKLQENCVSSNDIANVKAATNMGVTWARIYRKDFIICNDLKFILGLKRTQDAIFHLYALEVAKRVDYEDIPVYHYRIWDASASKKASKDFHLVAMEIINYINQFMNNTGKQNKFKKAYYSKVTKLLLEIVKLELVPRTNLLPLIKNRKILKELAESEPYYSAIRNVDYETLTKGQKIGCILLKAHLYECVLLLYIIKIKLEKYIIR